MIQDIYPSKLNNSFKDYPIRDTDFVIFFNDKNELLINVSSNGENVFPSYEMTSISDKTYLFSIDERRYFLAFDGEVKDNGCYEYLSIFDIRDKCTGPELYGAFTAYHLNIWYKSNKFCGVCGGSMHVDDKERALRCDKCNNIVYPRINPAVIVGVTNGDSILITKYREGYKHNALIAGFTEIGETLEETVKREVMEEAGIEVTNIRYYKSQPWGMASDILVGFFCDGEGEIKMDENELKYASWVKREDIVLQPNNLSLTNEMMQMFKENKL